MTTWRDSLRPANWRGLPFSVLSTEALSGRRVHLHEYPFRDQGWAEDLGRRSRGLVIRGYRVGDDVAQQLAEFQAAAEQKGSGELVHPFRDTVDVTLMGLSDSDAWDEGRVVRLIMEFVETGERRFPTFAADGAAEVGSAAAALDTASAATAEAGIIETLRDGYAGAQRIARTAQSYVARARSLVSSATGAIRSVTALAGVPGLGSLGRFIGSGSVAGRALGSLTSLSSGVSTALGRFNRARSAVTSLGSRVMSLASSL